MRMTTKGQVTVPKELRDLAGIHPGSEVAFDYVDGTITLSKAEKSAQRGLTRGQRVVEALRGTRTANKELSTDEIMRLMRPRD